MLSALSNIPEFRRLHAPKIGELTTHVDTTFVTLDRNLHLFEQQRHSRVFCQLACNFLVHLPGTKPLVALILNHQNVILETIAIRSAQFIINQMRLPCIEPGERFEPACSAGSIPYVDSIPHATVLSEPLSLGHEDWYIALSSIAHPTADSHDHRIVFLATVSTRLEELRESIITSAYAINRLWQSTLESKIQSTPKPDTSDTSQMLEPKLLDYDKNSSLATLCAGIAHEIRNPLTTARGFLQLFEQRCEEEDKTFLELTINELDRVGQLLEDFMDIARPSKEILERTDLCDLTHSVCMFLSPESKLRDVEMTYDVPDKSVPLRLQATRIKQVLINLLQNAVHACTPHGRVHIVIEDFDQYVSLTIADTGCGIQDLHQLFRPFHTTKKDGTGLGMFVSKHIIEQHGGNIQVESVVGKGTTLNITLPRL